MVNKEKNTLDIDARFLLANERTLLAWIRTGLTLIAGGVAVVFVVQTDTQLATLAGLGAIGFGGLLAMIGYIRYRSADAAIRQGRLPSMGMSGALTVLGVVIFAVMLVLVHELGVL